MSNVNDISRESWVLNTMPEWGSRLNEQIESEEVPKGSVAMWWLGCVGIWVKTPQDTNICVDFWCGTGKRKLDLPDMKPAHQMARMSGSRIAQPNLRAIPFVLDPFSITKMDAVVSTHYHADHIDINVAAAVLQNCADDVPFIGPQACVDLWVSWGVPKERCIAVKPGDVVRVKDMEILALEAFDRTILITEPSKPLDEPNGPDMDMRAVNYLIKTEGGNIYHSGDSHYSNYYGKHGKDHKIDVAFGSFGENPVGITDKMNAVDILRMAEALRAEVVIPVHHDIWTNMMADTNEILTMFDMRKYRLKYEFQPFIWQPGGKFLYPQDKNAREYHHPRGFPDAFEHEINLPYTSFL